MSKYNKKKIYPSSWIWPFRGILNFGYYIKNIRQCSPEEIGRMRKLIRQIGFNMGMESFEMSMIQKRAMQAYDKRKALEDIADGKQPGQSLREFEQFAKAEREKDESRTRKRRLLQELNQEIKNAELDRINEKDIVSSIEKIRKFGESNNK